MVSESTSKVLREFGSLLMHPIRMVALGRVLARDQIVHAIEQPHLYSFTKPGPEPQIKLRLLIEWLQAARRPDGGIAAFYSLFSGFSASYPETTGYIIPTLYDYSTMSGDQRYAVTAAGAASWLRSIQNPDGSFPGGLAGAEGTPSVFNTGQILQGLLRAAVEGGDEAMMTAAVKAGQWLVEKQSTDGRWEGPTYEGRAHSYYTMVAWSLAELGERSNDRSFILAAARNLQFVQLCQTSTSWYGNINLKNHPTYLHFVAYVIQGIVETSILLKDEQGFASACKAAWKLLRIFELKKGLPGAFSEDWRPVGRFSCLTGLAQMSNVWLRIHEHTGDLRYLNCALKANEFLKKHIASSGGEGIRGGLAGSFPIQGAYQPMRYISWGNKFAADAFMAEIRALSKVGQ
jgi:hypothetical protein